VADATYLPVGFGSHHWRVTDSDGIPWFATADTLEGDTAFGDLDGAFSVATAAVDAGVRGVHRPVPGAGGAVVVKVGSRYAVSLQPWLEGPAGRFGDRMDDAQALALVDLLVSLHSIPTARTRAPVEDTSVPGLPGLVAVLDAVRGGRVPAVARDGSGPLAPVVLEALRRRTPAVERAVAAVSSGTAPGVDRLVPTHGEPHPGNVVHTGNGPVLVDWETARLAEPERDLWHVAARTDLDVAALYAERSGRAVDTSRLRARRLHWALTDVADYVPTLVTAPRETADTAWQLEALLGTLDEL
jgi:spectinomycin phosphotransferase